MGGDDAKVIECTNELEVYKQRIKDNKLVVVDFTASWCPPCKGIKPLFHSFPASFPTVVFCSVDVDECSDVAGDEEITAMPTFKFYSDGVCVASQTGANPELLKKNVNDLVAGTLKKQ